MRFARSQSGFACLHLRPITPPSAAKLHESSSPPNAAHKCKIGVQRLTRKYKWTTCELRIIRSSRLGVGKNSHERVLAFFRNLPHGVTPLASSDECVRVVRNDVREDTTRGRVHTAPALLVGPLSAHMFLSVKNSRERRKRENKYAKRQRHDPLTVHY